ncbi:MAG: hypothetical protein KDB24_03935 [Microthrixaceae bacterium]|nr:hypothetical protein [Microthrixaceae bacterium]
MAPAKTTPTRIRLAAALTGVVAAVLAVVFVMNLGGEEQEAATTTTTTTAPSVSQPPPLYELPRSWNIRGRSRFADAERNKRRAGGTGPLVEGVENVPPARVNDTTTTIEQRVISLEESGALNGVTTTTGTTTPGSGPPATATSGAGG